MSIPFLWQSELFFPSMWPNLKVIPLQAKRVREVANLTEIKNQHTPVYGVKEFVCLSVFMVLNKHSYIDTRAYTLVGPPDQY